MKPVLLSILFLSLLLNIPACGKTDERNVSDEVSVTVYGAAEQVSGSLTLVETRNSKFIIDCGLYYPEGAGSDYESRQATADALNEELPVDAKGIDFAVLTHAHLDHVGRIPLLVEKGFKGTIYTAEHGRDILKEMLFVQIRYDNRERHWVFTKERKVSEQDSSLYVTAHWNNCEWQSRINSSNKDIFVGRRTEGEEKLGISFSPCKSCAEITLTNVFHFVAAEPYNKIVTHGKDVSFTYLDAGHIPGSASVLVEVPVNGVQRKLLFSGDLGNHIGILQNGPKPAPVADAIWIETTYGGHKRESEVLGELDQFKRDVSQVLKSGGIAWIPAFALDRSQKILHVIEEAKQEGVIPRVVPVFCPSPTAGNITDLYKRELSENSGWFRNDIYESSTVFTEHRRFVPESLPATSILITTSGMMDAAFSDKLAAELLPKGDVTVFLVGYQDPGTPGGQLKKGQKEIVWKDKKIAVNADVKEYKVFTAHADAGDITKWLENQDKKSVSLHLVHGERSSLNDQRQQLINGGFSNVFVPRKGETFQVR